MTLKQNSGQSGFTLIELMIGMLIGLVIVGAVVEVVMSSVIFFRTQSGLAKLQENARYATNFIAQDVRLSGYMGCDINATQVNVIADNSNAVPDELSFSQTLSGFDNVLVSSHTYGAGANIVTVDEGTDVLELKYASTRNICEIATHNTSSATFSCQSAHPFVKNTPLIATDCSQSAIFLQSNNSTTDINHGLMVGLNPKNCVANLGKGAAKCTAPPYQFTSGSIMALNSLVYFVAQNDLGQPALYRQTTSIDAAGALTNNPREIVEGVEDIQFLYGQDTTNDGAVNLYAPASAVDFAEVISLRVDILLRSIEDNLVDAPQTYDFSGRTIIATDRRLRKVVSTTIALRNRL